MSCAFIFTLRESGSDTNGRGGRQIWQILWSPPSSPHSMKKSPNLNTHNHHQTTTTIKQWQGATVSLNQTPLKSSPARQKCEQNQLGKSKQISNKAQSMHIEHNIGITGQKPLPSYVSLMLNLDDNKLIFLLSTSMTSGSKGFSPSRGAPC